MEDKVVTEGGGTLEYHKWQREQMAPRNISPEVMGRHKAMVFNAVHTGGFSVNAELLMWDTYSPEKKKLLISDLSDLADVKFLLRTEDSNDILQAVLAKKRELEAIQAMASVPVK